MAPTAHRYYGPLCLVGLVGLVALTSIHGPADPLLVWPLTALLTCGLIATLCLGGGISRWFAVRPLVAVGMTSYGLYLWHFPVFVTVDTVWGLETAGPRLVALLITAALVPLSYFFVEKPFLRLKRRFEPRPPTAEGESDIPRTPEKVLTPD
jgi:peptidoglycan/LPS O-acetylase OafA/YrhL